MIMNEYRIQSDGWKGERSKIFQETFFDSETGNTLRVTYTLGREKMPCGEYGCSEIKVYLKEKRQGGRREVKEKINDVEIWGIITNLVEREHNNIKYNPRINRLREENEINEDEFYEILMNCEKMLENSQVKGALDRACYSRPLR